MPLFSTILLNKIVLAIGGMFNKVSDYGWNEYFGGKMIIYLKGNSLKYSNYKYYGIIGVLLILTLISLIF